MDCEAIYTFSNGEQAFSECVAIDLTSEKTAKDTIRNLLKHNKENRKLVKASLAILIGKGHETQAQVVKLEKGGLLKWYFDANGKLWF